jgi:hypothetical protein
MFQAAITLSGDLSCRRLMAKNSAGREKITFEADLTVRVTVTKNSTEIRPMPIVLRHSDEKELPEYNQNIDHLIRNFPTEVIELAKSLLLIEPLLRHGDSAIRDDSVDRLVNEYGSRLKKRTKLIKGKRAKDLADEIRLRAMIWQAVCNLLRENPKYPLTQQNVADEMHRSLGYRADDLNGAYYDYFKKQLQKLGLHAPIWKEMTTHYKENYYRGIQVPAEIETKAAASEQELQTKIATEIGKHFTP